MGISMPNMPISTLISMVITKAIAMAGMMIDHEGQC
jgi:hypothetical protein